MVQEGLISGEELHKMNAIAFYEDAGRRNPDRSLTTLVEQANPADMGIDMEEAIDAFTRGVKEGRKAQAGNVEERFEDESGIEMEKDFENYPYDEQTVLKEYINSTNTTLLEKLRKFKANKKALMRKHKGNILFCTKCKNRIFLRRNSCRN